MDKPQTEVRVPLVLSPDVRHAVAVAHDFDAGVKPFDLDHFGRPRAFLLRAREARRVDDGERERRRYRKCSTYDECEFHFPCLSPR